MLGLYLAFLLGIDLQKDAGCIAAAFLLHYFVLATVFWMGVEARHMYITLVSESDRVGRKFMIKSGFFAWGKPTEIMSFKENCEIGFFGDFYVKTRNKRKAVCFK